MLHSQAKARAGMLKGEKAQLILEQTLCDYSGHSALPSSWHRHRHGGGRAADPRGASCCQGASGAVATVAQ
ncbi:hypothetical protein AAFF_G00213830 [Aldrovandia affinis]|uniref:Uncharacterized protein n=1 Tax=Aldrovandia affinis TaxID=143900 RepID=A0AAD7RH25_9TELE|nr:hypothetical protein AAFF_G00213830 [Aldrovandia affinis]